jgi:hypothetical protein
VVAPQHIYYKMSGGANVFEHNQAVGPPIQPLAQRLNWTATIDDV